MRYLIFTLLLGFCLSFSAPQAAAQDMEPVIYMTQYKIQEARMDSLSTLVSQYDLPWHNFISENVEGYQRWYFRHDTGNENNFMIVTMYPDWDMVRGDEIPFADLFPRFVDSIGMTMEEFDAEDGRINSAFQWAYEGAEHMDQIWRPIEVAEDED